MYLAVLIGTKHAHVQGPPSAPEGDGSKVLGKRPQCGDG